MKRSRRRFALGTVAVVAAASACAPMAPVVLPPSPVTFIEHTVDGSIGGPSFVSYSDALPGGGTEVVVSAFGKPAGGPGTVGIYQRTGAGLDSWTRTDVVTAADNIKYPNETTISDLNGDGRQDVVVTGGFFQCAVSSSGCGTLAWFENTVGGYVRHDILPPNQTNFFHRAVVVDLDGDGVTDIVTVGEIFTDAAVMWFKGDANPANPRFGSTPLIIGSGGGSLPEVRDVDGDGDLDVISPQFFAAGRSFAWWERTANPTLLNPTGTFADHTITGAVGASFAIRAVPNLKGDGITRWVGTNHVNSTFNGGYLDSGVYELTPPVDPTGLWTPTLLSQGIVARPTSPVSLAPGTFDVGDIDGDGRIDIAVSGDGDANLYWLQQQADHTFKTFKMDTDMGQAGGGSVADLDGDGFADVVFSSYEQDVVKIYSAS